MDTKQGNQHQSVISNPFTVTFIRIKARQLCQRSDFSRSDFDDLQQDMRVYLLEKTHLFNPDRGNLEAFVTKALRTWIAIQLRYRSREKRRESYKALSLERIQVKGEFGITNLGSVLLEEDGCRLNKVYPISDMEHFELREAVEHAMQSLTPEDRALLAQVIENGITSTAKSRGVSWRQVNNAMVRIRHHFEKSGLGPN